MGNLLARSAGNLFWLARYLERVENLARTIEITETFSRDSSARSWLSVVQINADEKRFFEKHEVADAPTVIGFYVLDPTIRPRCRPRCRRRTRMRARCGPDPRRDVGAGQCDRNHWRAVGQRSDRARNMARLCRRLKRGNARWPYRHRRGHFFA
jgi:hypothetical protein